VRCFDHCISFSRCDEAALSGLCSICFFFFQSRLSFLILGGDVSTTGSSPLPFFTDVHFSPPFFFPRGGVRIRFVRVDATPRLGLRFFPLSTSPYTVGGPRTFVRPTGVLFGRLPPPQPINSPLPSLELNACRRRAFDNCPLPF